MICILRKTRLSDNLVINYLRGENLQPGTWIMLLSVQWNQTKVSVLVCIQTNTGVAGLAITGGA